MLHKPFYDPTKSYEDNYEYGPYGAFADVLTDTSRRYIQKGEPQFNYHGHTIYKPIGIPPGPLINSRFVKAAFNMGFDICVYKTVRSDSYPCHPHPNILGLDIDGDLTMEKAKGQLVGRADYHEPLSITNSFGVPSKSVDFWQEDIKKALSYAGKGQVLVVSFMGTVHEGQTEEEFLQDHRLVAQKAHETGADLFEVNLSCPNIGNEGLICYNTKMSGKIVRAIREVLGNKQLSVKIGYFERQSELESFVDEVQEHVQGIAAINTIPTEVVDEKGNQALPGPNRLKSGICGSGIKWAGLEMTKRLRELREKHGYSYVIESMGGVMNAQDYDEYVRAGADVVMSATGSMWNPYLAQEIKAASK